MPNEMSIVKRESLIDKGGSYMLKKRLVGFIIGICALVVMCSGLVGMRGSANAAEKAYKMRLSHVYPDTTQHGRNANYFKELVEKETQGRVKVEIFPNAQLGSTKDEMGMVKAGTVEAVLTISSPVETLEPMEAIYAIPFLWKINPGDSKQFDILSQHNSLIESSIRNKMKEKGIYRLGCLNTQYGHVIVGNNVRRVTKPEDMKGLKIRYIGGLLGKVLLDKVGASGMVIAGPEVPVALNQGVIDGIQSAVLHIHDARWITKYILATIFRPYTIPLCVNLKWWESLPKDLQDIIQLKVMTQAQSYATTETIKLEKEAVKKLQQPPFNVVIDIVKDEDVEKWANYNNMREEGIKRYLSAVGPEGQKLIDEVNRVGKQFKN